MVVVWSALTRDSRVLTARGTAARWWWLRFTRCTRIRSAFNFLHTSEHYTSVSIVVSKLRKDLSRVTTVFSRSISVWRRWPKCGTTYLCLRRCKIPAVFCFFFENSSTNIISWKLPTFFLSINRIFLCNFQVLKLDRLFTKK